MSCGGRSRRGRTFIVFSGLGADASGMSLSTLSTDMLALLTRRGRARGAATGLVGPDDGAIRVGFGGPGAMATTVFIGRSAAPELVGVVTDVPVDPADDLGESASFERALDVMGGGRVACATEFLRLAAFLARELPIAPVLAAPRFRFLITSVLRLSGRTTPCSFRNNPQALHKGCPSGFRRHRGVVCVKQFVHVVGAPLLSVPSLGLPGREGAAELKPDSAGDVASDDCAWIENMPVAMPTVLGVDVVRGIFRVRGSMPPRLRISLTDVVDPWPRLSVLCSQFGGVEIVSVGPMVTPFRGGPPGYLAAVKLN